jgi:hypothetical protein
VLGSGRRRALFVPERSLLRFSEADNTRSLFLSVLEEKGFVLENRLWFNLLLSYKWPLESE